MKNQRKKNCSPVFTILLLVFLFAAQTQTARAQKEPTENKLLKYELSIDLVPIIDEGQFGKIYFKINQYKEDQLKGAYRLGVSRGTYLFDKLDRTNMPDNIGTSRTKFSNLETRLYLGYEKYKMIGNVLIYYGADIETWYFQRQNTPRYTDDQRSVTMGICPFGGIKHFIYKNIVSISFEVGWENTITRSTNLYPTNGVKENYFNSSLRLPYNFTLNYNL